MCARGPKSCAGRARRRAHTEITLGTVISMVPRVVPGRLQECPSLKSQMELGGQKSTPLIISLPRPRPRPRPAKPQLRRGDNQGSTKKGPLLVNFGARAPGARAGARHRAHTRAAEKRDGRETDARNASRDARDAHSIVITRRPYAHSKSHTDQCIQTSAHVRLFIVATRPRAAAPESRRS